MRPGARLRDFDGQRHQLFVLGAQGRFGHGCAGQLPKAGHGFRLCLAKRRQTLIDVLNQTAATKLTPVYVLLLRRMAAGSGMKNQISAAGQHPFSR